MLNLQTLNQEAKAFNAITSKLAVEREKAEINTKEEKLKQPAKPRKKGRKSIAVAARREDVAKHYNGKNCTKLARKHGTSRQTIFNDARLMGKIEKTGNYIDDPEFVGNALELLKTLSHSKVADVLDCCPSVIGKIAVIYGDAESMINDPDFIKQLTGLLAKKYSIDKISNIMRRSKGSIRACIRKYNLR